MQRLGLVREKYPDWTIGDTEGFPALSAKQVIEWIDRLEEKLNAKNVRCLDFMRLDVDWMHFVHNTGKGSWADLKRVEEHCRKKKLRLVLSIGLPDTMRYRNVVMMTI
ncbi:MAG: hypothetical protein LBL62_10435 [Planctomycetaceae bacterium]|nr:hypothetical protein [Planctomycetaceae bacterium]